MTDLINPTLGQYLFNTAKAQAEAMFTQTPTGAAMPVIPHPYTQGAPANDVAGTVRRT